MKKTIYVLLILLFLSCVDEEAQKNKKLQKEEILTDIGKSTGLFAPYKSNYEIFMNDLCRYFQKKYLKNEAFVQKWSIDQDTTMGWMFAGNCNKKDKKKIMMGQALHIGDTCYYTFHFDHKVKLKNRHSLILVCNPREYEIYRESYEVYNQCHFDDQMRSWCSTQLPPKSIEKYTSCLETSQRFSRYLLRNKDTSYIPYGHINNILKLDTMHRRPEFKHYHYTCEDYGKKIFTWYKPPK